MRLRETASVSSEGRCVALKMVLVFFKKPVVRSHQGATIVLDDTHLL